MSSRKGRVVLAPAARLDLQDILRFTTQRWGRRQRAIYKQALEHGFDALARFPFMGKEQPEHGEHARCFPIEQHVIIYEVTKIDVLIARKIHIRRDIAGEIGM
jgi:toxin ParE1/3/4